MKIPFEVDNAITRLQCAAQSEGEAYDKPGKLPALQQRTNKMRAELVKAIEKALSNKV